MKFPFHKIPSNIVTHVNIEKWKEYILLLRNKKHLSYHVPLMEKVLENLQEGCDSGVGPPGNQPTHSKNSFDNPSLDIPRILDAIATEVKAKTMSGPFPIGFIPNAKVNGFLSIIKPGGARRQVGNLAAPRGASFNEGICEESLKEWQVFQLTSKQFSYKIARAGKNAVFSCSRHGCCV